MSEATIPVQAAAPPPLSEDLVAVGLGLGVFVLALLSLLGADALGWLVTTSVWTLPIEKKLIGWSLGAGLALLGRHQSVRAAQLEAPAFSLHAAR